MHSLCGDSERHVVKSLPCGWDAWLCVNKEHVCGCLLMHMHVGWLWRGIVDEMEDDREGNGMAWCAVTWGMGIL